MRIQQAAFIAIKALAYISQSEQEMTKFLKETGISTPDVIRLKENLKFLSGVLSFLRADESLLLAFCAQEGFNPTDIELANNCLTEHET